MLPTSPSNGDSRRARRPGLPAGPRDGDEGKSFLATKTGRRVVLLSAVFVATLFVILDRLVWNPYEPARPLLSGAQEETRDEVARDFFPLEAREDLGLIFDGQLRGVEDRTEVEDDRALYALVEAIRRDAPEDHEDDSIDNPGYGLLVDHPAAYRGRTVRLRVLPIFVRPRRLGGPGPPVDSVVRVYATDPYGNDEGFVVDLVDDLPAGVSLRRDVLEIHGIFLKVSAYLNEDGETKLAPFFVARRARVFDAFLGRQGGPRSQWPLVAFIVTVGGSLVFLGYSRYRKSRDRRDEQRARLRDLRERRDRKQERTETSPRF